MAAERQIEVNHQTSATPKTTQISDDISTLGWRWTRRLAYENLSCGNCVEQVLQ
jgi:hypothetical protein